MSVYVITGASRGIGFELLKQISDDPKNFAIGLVRNTVATQEKVDAQLPGRSNVHVLHGDLDDYSSLVSAVAKTTSLVGGRGVDYLIANGAAIPTFDAYDSIGSLKVTPAELKDITSKLFQTNVIGNVHLFNLFVPLVMKSKVKKVIAISSGHGDLNFINQSGVEVSSYYAALKAALNVIVAKFSAQYKEQGVLFASMSPGVVEVGHFADGTTEQMEKFTSTVGKLASYAPDFKGPTPVEQAIPIIRSTWERMSIEDGYAGTFVSHFGNKQWL